jgi:hypothetical protein
MHVPTCTFWANLTPFLLASSLRSVQVLESGGLADNLDLVALDNEGKIHRAYPKLAS